MRVVLLCIKICDGMCVLYCCVYRLRLVEERDNMQKQMEDTKQDATDTLSEFNKRIKEGKATHDSLSQQVTKVISLSHRM